MATFKVGQRVRVVRSAGFWPEAVGREATIVAIHEDEHWLAIDGLPLDSCLMPGKATGWCERHQIVPLTDPDAERFVENLKKLVREPIPLTPAQLEEVK